MSADNRSVSTDALATLGTIIDESAGRDAIHLAVEPVIAGEELRPGADVGLRNGYGPLIMPRLLQVIKPPKRSGLKCLAKTLFPIRKVDLYSYKKV